MAGIPTTHIDTIVLVTITAVILPTGTDITAPGTTMVALDITGTDLAITATGTTARAHTITAVIVIVFAAEMILAYGRSGNKSRRRSF
jgi:hypothetical protein